jgi:hypothetical protein
MCGYDVIVERRVERRKVHVCGYDVIVGDWVSRFGF